MTSLKATKRMCYHPVVRCGFSMRCDHAMRIAWVISLVLFLGHCMRASAESWQDGQYFDSEIRPLLIVKCYECNGEKKQKGDLRVDGRAHLLKDGNNGPALVASLPETSLMMKVIRITDPDFSMPPKEALQASDVGKLEKWITLGVPWPNEKKKLTVITGKAFTEKERSWWAVQPVCDQVVSSVPGDWGLNLIGQFIASKLRLAGLKPAPKGDTVDLSVEGVWSRRLTQVNFKATKREPLWKQNGGDASIETDYFIVNPTR